MEKFFNILKKFFLLLAAILFLQAFRCNLSFFLKEHTTSTQYIYKNLYVDDRFTDEEILIIEQAANEWKQRTKNVFDFKLITNVNKSILPALSDSAGIYFYKISTREEISQIKDDDSEEGYTLGLYDLKIIGTPTIFLVPSRINGFIRYRAVVEHEMGHSLGLNHSDNPKDLMYFQETDYNLELTKNDLKYFCKIYFCKL